MLASVVNDLSISPRDHVAAWLCANEHRIGSSPIKFERCEKPAQTLDVWFSTPEYLIDITTWDHAFCLDIVVLNQKTGTTIYCVAGSCEDNAGLTHRLNEFLLWLESQ